MAKVVIELCEEEYKALLRLTYFADYCAFAGALRQSCPSDSSTWQISCDAVTKLYEAGDQVDLPRSSNLSSMSEVVRFTEVEMLEMKRRVETDLDKIAKSCVAQAFAETEVDRAGLDFSYEGGWLHKQDLIVRRMARYLEEFKANGFSNLRIKLFHTLPPAE